MTKKLDKVNKKAEKANQAFWGEVAPIHYKSYNIEKFGNNFKSKSDCLVGISFPWYRKNCWFFKKVKLSFEIPGGSRIYLFNEPSGVTLAMLEKKNKIFRGFLIIL